jgi:hypothetical protein
MKLHSLILIALLINCRAHAQDICHFTKVDIPRNEARLLELARVIEFRCDSILPQVQVDEGSGTSQFIAERYQNGKCVGRQCFSLGVFSKDELLKGSYRGIISFGWHMDDQKLVGVHDTGYFHQTGFANLPGFDANRPNPWVCFKDSQAEPRTSNGGLHFDLYPIIAMRGSKPWTVNGAIISGRLASAFYSLPSDQLTSAFKKYPDAVIVYLSFGAGLPQLDYDKKEADGADQPATAVESKAESGEKTKSEPKVRSQ